MAYGSQEIVQSASTVTSCSPSRSSSHDPTSSETSHSTVSIKSQCDLGHTGNHGAPASEHQSSDIFSLSDQQLSEKMRFIQEIGFGNWGSVWLCEPRLAEERAMYGTQVAVKLVHRSKTPTTAARVRSLWNEMKIVRALRREASAAGDVAGVGHPSVVQFYSFVITPSYALITMQYLPTPVPVEVPEFRAKPWFVALTDAVAFLHQRGVVHNDIKPANILLTGARPPLPVLVDFGFAEHYTMTSRHAFQSNLAYGTPEYLAPERARGQPHDTRKSDVYALGVTFFEILVGRTPFEEVEGESFVTKEDLEKYWARTVKGKWVGKWEGIMTKQCEKALKRMTAPNADLRATATDVLNDPYFNDQAEDTSRSNLSLDLSALSEMMPPWSRPTLAPPKPKANATLKNARSNESNRQAKTPASVRSKAAVTKAARPSDKENAQPAKSDTVRSRSGTLHKASRSITEAFRKSVGASRAVPKKTAADVFAIGEAALKKDTKPVLKTKDSRAVLRETKSQAVLREKNVTSPNGGNVLKEKASAPVLKEKRSAAVASAKAAPKKEPEQDKENVKAKTPGRTLSMNLSFTRSFGRKKAKDKENAEAQAGVERRESMYFARPATANAATAVSGVRAGAVSPRSAAGAISPTPSVHFGSVAVPSREATKVYAPSSRITPASAAAKGQTRPALNTRDVRSVFGMTDATGSVDSSRADQKLHNSASMTSVRSSSSTAEERKVVSTPTSESNLREAGTPRLETIGQSPSTIATTATITFAVETDTSVTSTAPSAATPTKKRVTKIAAKENRRTTVVARTSPSRARGTTVKARASPSKPAASPLKARKTNVPVFAIGPKAGNTTRPKVAVPTRGAKVLGDTTNFAGSLRNKKSSQGGKKSKTKIEDIHDEGDDTITLPIEIFKNATLPRMPKESNTSILKQSLRQSIDKAVRFGRSSVSATESTHYPMSETTQHRRSLSVGEAWGDEAVNQIVKSSLPAVRQAFQDEQLAGGDQVDRMAIWIRNVEKVVEDARQSFQAGTPIPFALPPPPPRLNHSQSSGLTRISTSAKDPTIRTLTSDVNPSVTTFAGAPQAPARARRATVGSSSCSGASVGAILARDPQVVPQGGIARPITPCLNAELGKEPVSTAASPRLSDVLDPDSRNLILAQVGRADTPIKSLDRERATSPSLVLPSKSTQSTQYIQTPPLTPSESSRPTTSMSARNDSTYQAEGEYERYILSQTNVVRKGKGYQSDYTIRGKGIEHIPSNSNLRSAFNTTPNPKRNSMFNRAPERSNTVQRVANAFKTMVTGGSKKREHGITGAPIVVGGGFNPGVEAPWTKKEAPRSVRTWSRAQAA